MSLFKNMLIVVAAGTVAAGCGSDDNKCGDASCPDSSVVLGDAAASAGDGPMLWGLTSGTNNFTVTAVSNVNDGCMLGVAGLVNKTLPVNYTGGMVSIGELQGSPPQASLGTG